MTARHRLALILPVLLAALLVSGPAGRARDDVALDEQLARLSRLGTIAYVTAHPDDESAGIITYLARGLHARVVILCLTRGAGGQNQAGPELNDDLAAVRTEELRRAAAGYGAEVRFLGARDFGYSKSVEETLARWNEQELVARLVHQMRALRPLAVISHWTGTPRDGGNAHHRAAGLLTRRAFALAGDPGAFPEQLVRGLPPWQPRYLLFRSYDPNAADFPVPARQPSPVPGKTYEELGLEAFRHHRSQGLGDLTLERLQNFVRGYYLQVAATVRGGPPAPTHVAELAPDLASLPQLFPEVEAPGGWRERLVEVVRRADRGGEHFRGGHTAEAVAALVEGAQLLEELRREFPPGEPGSEAHMLHSVLADRQQQFLRTAADLTGVTLKAVTDRALVPPGDTLWVDLELSAARHEIFAAAGFATESLQLAVPEDWRVEPATAAGSAAPAGAEYLVHLPAGADPQQLPHPPLRAVARLAAGPLPLTLVEPVRGLAGGRARPESFWDRLDPRRWLRDTLSESGEAETAEPPEILPVTLAPAITLAVRPELRLVRSRPGVATYDVQVRLRSHSARVQRATVWLEAPSGWATPAPREIELPALGSVSVRFSLTLPPRVPPGRYRVQAVALHDEQTFRLARRRRLGATGEPPTVFEPARARLQVIDFREPAGLRVGYIGFNQDPVPALLAQLGVAVDLLDPEALARRDLDIYDALLVATRAYDYRDDLKEQTRRLLAYVRRGGTLLVEHQGRGWDPTAFAPYPGEKSGNLRVTRPDAPVTLLAPAHSVFTFPNEIGPQDWEGWVQERGLYFWESWSEDYTPLVELADPNEEPRRGALLHARYGRGHYIYCGLALFRQVRAGVPGGVRLYLNLLSQSRPRVAGQEAGD